MKRYILILTIIILSVFMISCNTEYTVILQDDDKVFALCHVKNKTSLKDVLSEYDEPVKEGYTFLGWGVDEQKIDENIKIKDNLTLYSLWTINQYTYIFKDYDGTIIKQLKVDYLTTIEAPMDPTREHYTFKGWDQTFTKITTDITITAVYQEQIKYTFIDYDGTILKQTYVDKNTTIVPPENPNREGFTFLGWDQTFDKAIEDITIKATYQEYLTYKFVDNEGLVIKEIKAPYGTIIEEPTVVAKDGYRFSKWDKDFNTLTENITITGIYIKQYVYTFIDWDGTVLKEEQLDVGASIMAPSNPSRYGYIYVFSGWDQTFDKLTADIVIKATYTERTYNLTGKKISFLGDSISTFYAPNSPANSEYSGTDQFYYPKYSSTVTTVDKTWWYQVIKNTNTVLGVNDSLSGSDLVNSASTTTRITNLGRNGNPDIVIIHIGTNDNVNGHTKANFLSAYRSTINQIKSLYPGVIIFCCTLGYSAYDGYYYNDLKRNALNDAILSLKEEYNVGIIDIASVQTTETFKNILGDFLHPSAKGMTIYATEAVRAMKEYLGIK